MLNQEVSNQHNCGFVAEAAAESAGAADADFNFGAEVAETFGAGPLGCSFGAEAAKTFEAFDFISYPRFCAQGGR